MCPWMIPGFESLLTFPASTYWNTSGGGGGEGGLRCYSTLPYLFVDCALKNHQPVILRMLGESNIWESIQHHLWILARSFSTSHICTTLKFSLLYLSIKIEARAAPILSPSSSCPKLWQAWFFDVMNGKTNPTIRNWKNWERIFILSMRWIGCVAQS